MKKVFVCAGMGVAKNDNINLQARLLGELLAKNKCLTYVQGGSDKGLMGETLKEFLKHSNNVEFLIPDTYFDYDAPKLIELVGKDNFKATKTKGEAGRLTKIIRCDFIVVLPGGTGTIEELLYCNETCRAKEHKSKIFLVNIDGYFDGLLKQIKTNIEQGLSKSSAINFEVVDSVKTLEKTLLDNYDIDLK